MTFLVEVRKRMNRLKKKVCDTVTWKWLHRQIKVRAAFLVEPFVPESGAVTNELMSLPNHFSAPFLLQRSCLIYTILFFSWLRRLARVSPAWTPAPRVTRKMERAQLQRCTNPPKKPKQLLVIFSLIYQLTKPTRLVYVFKGKLQVWVRCKTTHRFNKVRLITHRGDLLVIL